MIEGALSEKATDVNKAIKAWLFLWVVFGVVLGVTALLVLALGTWGESFASVAPGVDGWIMAVGFIVNICAALAMLCASCLSGIHLVAGTNRLLHIFSNQRRIARDRAKAENERQSNWQAQLKR